MIGTNGQIFLPPFPTAASFTDQVTGGSLCANQLATAAGLFSAAGEAPIADVLEGLALLSAGGAPETDGTKTLHETLLRMVDGNPDAVTRALSPASGWRPAPLSVFSPSPAAAMLAAVENGRRGSAEGLQISLGGGFVPAPANRPKRDIFHAAGSDDAAKGPAGASGAAESAAPSDNAVMEARREKIRALAAMGIPAYPNGIRAENTAKEILESYGTASGDDLEKTPRTVSLAGRIMAIRRLGGAVFMQIQDRTGALQVFVRKDNVSEEMFNLQKLFDVGDIALFEGPLVRTKTNELSILARDLRLVTKSVRPLPEKWHGLTDREVRYRQRYVDLIVNPAVREAFVKRSAVIQAIREYMLRKHFLEVETPMMHPIPGGAAARPFVTHHNALGADLYMRIAPELYLKRLVVGGLERVFEINRNFRNEGMSPHHNPEFTMMEFYHSYATYRDLMELTEDLLCHTVEAATGGTQIKYQGKVLDFGRPFKRYTMKEALAEIGGVPPEVMESADSARSYAERNRIEIKTPDASLGMILAEMLGALVEPKLIQPTFITEYPTETSPLSRRNDDDPSIVDRFELFIAGMEIANAFSELNDPADQAARFREQVKARDSGDDEAMYYDADYVRALEYGMPPTAGEGIGIDRLVMLITNSPSIRDVILFPQMRKE